MFDTKIYGCFEEQRRLLSILSSIYDPMWIIAPVVLPAKIILQDLCRLKLGWDDDLPKQVKQMWIDWLNGLHQLEEFKVSKCIKPADFGEAVVAQLHHFADAREDAYCTASYHPSNQQEHCALIMGKALLKRPIIPRMELTAATVATKNGSNVKKRATAGT